MTPFTVLLPETSRIPVLLSVPHCGTRFPDELRGEYKESLCGNPDDTDWFVDRLYDFGPSLGMTMIAGVYSRWVIDLNRNPDDKPLYTDGRIITGLCPVTNFLGESIYIDERREVEGVEIERRLEHYYRPYHQKLKELLLDLKTEFGKVLLWDCHSIRQYVSTIYHENFPDLVLGDADGTSASPASIESSYNTLKASSYSLRHNFPFKGGFITRHYGNPLENQHALQLEMSKINYMDDTEKKYDPDRAERMRTLLKGTILSVAQSLG